MARKFALETVKAIQAFRTNPATARMQVNEIAEKLDLHPSTVSTIENQKNYWEEVFAEVRRTNRKREAVIWDAFIRQCEKGSLQHILIYFEMMGYYSVGAQNKPQETNQIIIMNTRRDEIAEPSEPI
jgi:hypothetical protein